VHVFLFVAADRPKSICHEIHSRRPFPYHIHAACIPLCPVSCAWGRMTRSNDLTGASDLTHSVCVPRFTRPLLGCRFTLQSTNARLYDTRPICTQASYYLGKWNFRSNIN
jgi:hypothetical protein